MTKKTILIFIIASAICLIISLASIAMSLKTSILLTKTKTNSENLIKSENDLKLSRDELKKYKYLLDNFNSILLKTIYYGTAESESGGSGHSFTAFSLFYKEKFYLITAGHSIEMDGVKYKNFKFKPNYRDIWLTPELLYYENDTEKNNDFAIFQDDFILRGLYSADKNLKPEFIVGNTSRNANIIKEYDEDVFAVYGESGSPVLNSECRVVGVLTKNDGEYTEIEKVLIALEQIWED